MQRLGQIDQALDQLLRRRSANDDGLRIEHVLDHAEGIAQALRSLLAPLLQRLVVGVVQPVEQVRRADLSIIQSQRLGQ
ncbi:hypothetical protein D3C81_1965550 [compost metagenome]